MGWEIAPWRPFRELEKMRREMDWLWDSFFAERPRRKGEEVGENDILTIKPISSFS